jgi:hypothetical protein
MNNISRIFTGLIVLVFFTSIPLIVFASDNVDVAKLPYDYLFQLQETLSQKLPKDLPFYLRIFSSNPEVKSSDITLRLVSKNETVEIALDQWGYIDLPIRRDLVGEGAFVISNQPKGTMLLQGVTRSQIPLQNRSIRYKALLSPVIAAKSAKGIGQSISEIKSAKYRNSLHLIIDQEGSEPVIIRLGNEKTVKLTPDEFGNVLIPLEDNLLQKNPIVEFPSDKVFLTTPCE